MELRPLPVHSQLGASEYDARGRVDAQTAAGASQTVNQLLQGMGVTGPEDDRLLTTAGIVPEAEPEAPVPGVPQGGPQAKRWKRPKDIAGSEGSARGM